MFPESSDSGSASFFGNPHDPSDIYGYRPSLKKKDLPALKRTNLAGTPSSEHPNRTEIRML